VKRSFATILAASLLLGGALACRDYLPNNRFMRLREMARSDSGTADARRAFSHKQHADSFGKAAVACGDCHRFDAEIRTGSEPLAATLSQMALLPGGAACHYCHGPSGTRVVAAPRSCITCHSNTAALLPENHQIAWLRVHASVASADPAECQNCHRDSFCVNCHQNRDSILTFVHDRNYISYHSVDARANPIQCGNCHRVDFCSNCHQQARRGFP